jgi:Cu(I)/Ag(I) efflux system membrane fusion protein/cobalt-zinc-cadmium efflux system membrane fusion protein
MSIKNIIWISILLVALSGAFVLSGCGGDDETEATAESQTQLWTCSMHPEVIMEEPGDCPKCGMKLVPVKQTQEEAVAQENEAQLWTCGMHPEVIMDEPGRCPKCGMELVPVKSTSSSQKKPEGERKILYWQAPMDPTEIYDHPGKSKMGMDLVPVYEGEAEMGAGGAITIDPVTVQNMGVRTQEVQRMDFTRMVRTVGKIEYDEEKLYTVTTKISGWIERLYVDYTGKLVNKGNPLLEIYSPDLVSTQEEYLLALNTQKMVSESSIETIRDGAESLLESTRKRLLYWDVPQARIKELEETGKVQKTVLLEAPATGMVVHKNAVEGMHIKEGMNLYQIADLSTVWVHASIYDNEVPWVEEGQNAEMELSYLPDKTYTGKVDYVYPYLREKARDVHVRLEFANPNLELKPGMYVNVRLKGRVVEDALVVPSEAVLRSGERNIAFVTRRKGKFEPREIRIGIEGGPNNNYIQVISGLFEGEKIVTSAQFLLDSESRLQEAIQKMLQERQNKMDQGKSADMKMDMEENENSQMEGHQH